MRTKTLIMFTVSLSALLFAASAQGMDSRWQEAEDHPTPSVIEQPITGNEDLGDLSQPVQALAHFYRAFNRRDLAMMEQSWDHSDQAVEVTPYGGMIRGWPAIRRSYERFFNSPARVQVEFYDYSLETFGDLFYAVGWERVHYAGQGKKLEFRVRVTRIFRREDDRWREIHHHESFEDPQQLAAYQAALKEAKR
jgi:ketosteroid isomerase-like protein